MPFFIPGIRSLLPKRGKRPSAKKSTAAAGRGHGREAAALVLIAAGIYCALALASYRAHPLRPDVYGDDWVGPVGAIFARGAVVVLGVAAWLIPLELVLLARP